MSSSESSDPRGEARSNVFLSAVLRTAAGTVPVRIRNMATMGALLDGEGLPESGEVVLVRGGLRVAGEVAWSGAGVCGLRFDSPIVVSDWVRRIAHPGQQRVDSIVAALRVGAIPCSRDAVEDPAGLGQLAGDLASVAARLAALPNLTTELGDEILKLEAIARALEQHRKGAPQVHSIK